MPKGKGRKASLRTKFQRNGEPRLPRKAQMQFDSFVNLANMTTLHPNDWDRFYAFICHSHKHALKLNETELERLLVKAGFSEEKAKKLSHVYLHGRRILQVNRRGFSTF